MNANNDQIGNKITLIPIFDVQNTNGNNFSLTTDRNVRILYTQNDLVFDQKASESEGGVLYNQSLTAIVAKNKELMRYNNMHVLIVLETLSGKTIVWGSKQFPVRSKCVPLITAISIELSCSTIFPVFFED